MDALPEWIDTEIAELGERIFKSAQFDFEAITLVFFKLLKDHCESPIECMLGTAMCLHAHMVTSLHGLNCVLPWQKPKEPCAPNNFLLVPQFKYGIYRFDFAFTNAAAALVLVECDGHDFHERTKGQAAHDRQKDRFTQISNIPILRYTGSEIYADAYKCASEVLLLVEDRINDQQDQIEEPPE